jgi:hypothetical protein
LKVVRYHGPPLNVVTLDSMGHFYLARLFADGTF